MTPQEVSDHIDIDKIPNQWKKVFGVIGKTGEGLKEAMDWFSSQI
jgi:hypothetical protein